MKILKNQSKFCLYLVLEGFDLIIEKKFNLTYTILEFEMVTSVVTFLYKYAKIVNVFNPRHYIEINIESQKLFIDIFCFLSYLCFLYSWIPGPVFNIIFEKILISV